MAVEIHFTRDSLLESLEEKLAVEQDLFGRCLVLKPPESSNDVGPLDRDRAVRWMWRTHVEVGLHADTFVLGASLIDRFLAKVKVNLKYLRCAALTSYAIAAKTLEEPERVPSMLQLIKTTHGKFGPQDMIKMEHIIIQKLEWKIVVPNAYDFLNLFVALLWQNPTDAMVQNLDASDVMERVVVQLHECLCSSTFLKFKGSVLVLALISCVLESSSQSWFGTVTWIQKLAKVETKDLLTARHAFESVSRSVRPQPIVLPQRGLTKQQQLGMLSPIQENPFESEFAAWQCQRSGACAQPSAYYRATSPTKRLVQDDNACGKSDVAMEKEGQRWPRRAIKRVRRACFNGYTSNDQA